MLRKKQTNMKKQTAKKVMEIEAIKRKTDWGNLEMENLEKQTGTTDANINKRIQEMEESPALEIQ